MFDFLNNWLVGLIGLLWAVFGGGFTWPGQN